MKIVLDLALSSTARCQHIDFNSCKSDVCLGNYSKLKLSGLLVI